MAHELIGALIGIARASEGNEDLFTQDMAFFLAKALCAGKDAYDVLLQEATDIKRKLVPDCFYCCNPCGRTENYNLSKMKNEPDDVVSVKTEILRLVKKLGIVFQIEDASLLLDALVMVGLDVEEPSYLMPTLKRLKERLQNVT